MMSYWLETAKIQYLLFGTKYVQNTNFGLARKNLNFFVRQLRTFIVEFSFNTKGTVQKLLCRFGMDKFKSSDTPLPNGFGSLAHKGSELPDFKAFQTLTGCLMYSGSIERPYLA